CCWTYSSGAFRDSIVLAKVWRSCSGDRYRTPAAARICRHARFSDEVAQERPSRVNTKASGTRERTRRRRRPSIAAQAPPTAPGRHSGVSSTTGWSTETTRTRPVLGGPRRCRLQVRRTDDGPLLEINVVPLQATHLPRPQAGLRPQAEQGRQVGIPTRCRLEDRPQLGASERVHVLVLDPAEIARPARQGWPGSRQPSLPAARASAGPRARPS